MSSADKVVLVTGGNAGIGAAIARYYAKEKCKIIIIGRDEQELENVAKFCTRESNIEAVAIEADLASDTDIERIVETVKRTTKKLDILVNNAAVYLADDIYSTSMISFDTLMRTNLRSAVAITKNFVPLLVEGKGNIVNISGLSSIAYVSGCFSKGLSKAGLENFTKYAAVELAPKKVRVNGLTLGYVKNTKIISRIGVDCESFEKEYVKKVLLGENLTPEDVVEYVAFIASDKARHLTGQNIVVDGGYTL